MIEVMKSRRLEVLGLAETLLKGSGDLMIHGNYKVIYSGNDDGRHGVGIILSPKVACVVSGVQQKTERIIGVDLKLDQDISLIQVYAPQAGRSMGKKMNFMTSYKHR